MAQDINLIFLNLRIRMSPSFPKPRRLRRVVSPARVSLAHLLHLPRPFYVLPPAVLHTQDGPTLLHSAIFRAQPRTRCAVFHPRLLTQAVVSRALPRIRGVGALAPPSRLSVFRIPPKLVSGALFLRTPSGVSHPPLRFGVGTQLPALPVRV